MNLFEQIQQNWPAVLAIGNVAIAGLMWRFSRVFATKESVKDLTAAHQKSAETIQMLQSEQRVIAERLNSLPSVRDVADLRENTAALAEASTHLNKSIELLSRRVELLTENELRGTSGRGAGK